MPTTSRVLFLSLLLFMCAHRSWAQVQACAADTTPDINAANDLVPWPVSDTGVPYSTQINVLANDTVLNDGPLTITTPLTSSFGAAQLGIVDNGHAIVFQPAQAAYPGSSASLSYSVRSSGGLTATARVFFTQPNVVPQRSVAFTYTCQGPGCPTCPGQQCYFTAVPRLTDGTPVNQNEIRSYTWNFQNFDSCNKVDWRGLTTYCAFSGTSTTTNVSVTANYYTGERPTATQQVSWQLDNLKVTWSCNNLLEPRGLTNTCRVTSTNASDLEDSLTVDWADGSTPTSLQFGQFHGDPFTHTFPAPGLYRAVMTGLRLGVTRQFPLDIEVVNQAPVVSAIQRPVDVDQFNLGATVTDDHDVMNAPPAWRERTYLWDFGDGAFDSLQNVSHRYLKPGSYTASVTVTDDLGASTTASTLVKVNAVRPVARFTYTCSGNTCTLDPTTSSAESGVRLYDWTINGVSYPRWYPDSPAISPWSLGDGPNTVKLRITDNAGRSSDTFARIVTPNTTPAPGALNYYALAAPCRLEDNRFGQGLNSGAVTGFTPQGRCGIPPSAKAVALNVTVFSPNGSGHLTLWPAGRPLPPTSVVNFSPESSPRSNNVILYTLDGNPQINVTTYVAVPAGTTGVIHYTIDTTGYFDTGTTVDPIVPPATLASRGPLRYQPLDPCRVIDSRLTPPSLPQSQVIYAKVAGKCGVGADAEAIAANLTAVNTTSIGDIIAYDSALGTAVPSGRAISFPRAATVANGAIVRLGRLAGSDVALFESGGSTSDYLIDVTGVFSRYGRLQFYALAPCRALDTRLADGGYPRMAHAKPMDVQIAGNCGVPAGAAAVLASAVAVAPDGDGYLQLYPKGTAPPVSSVVNMTRGDVIANSTIVPLGNPPNDLSILASITGTSSGTDVILDVYGYFMAPPPAAAMTPEVN